MDGAINRRKLLRVTAAGTAAAVVPAAAAKAAPSKKRVNVVIVGAGASGLYAADVLKGRRSVVVLEANERTGGRLLNGRIGPRPDDISELGGEWINVSQRLVKKLLRRYRLGVFPTYTTGNGTLIWDGKVSRFDTVPDLPGGGTVELLAAFAELTLMAAAVPVHAPWKAPDAADWDSQTAQTWIDDNVTIPSAKYFAEVAMGGGPGARAEDISLLHYLFIAAAAGGPAGLITQGEGALQYRVQGGTARMVQGLTAQLRSIIRLSTPVTMIEHGARSVRVTTPNGVWLADRVIVAMAPTMTQQILFDPVLPVARNQSVQRIGMGATIKAFAVYKTPFWRQQNLSGTIQSNSTIFGTAFDNSPKDGSLGVMLVLIEGNEARELSTWPKSRRQAAVVNGLAKALGKKALHPTKYSDQNWTQEPWIRGGAASCFPPGVLTEFRYLFEKPIGRIHFAGTETGTKWWGNIESALESGERAANEVLHG
jgi:monoamine oxidase